jgi:hypothetical protein
VDDADRLQEAAATGTPGRSTSAATRLTRTPTSSGPTEAGTKTSTYRSWIHHNILGSSNWTVIEDVAGCGRATTSQVELSPINIGWPNFAVNNLRYRNADLSIVWDDPADGVVKYPASRRATRSTSTATGSPPSTRSCRFTGTGHRLGHHQRHGRLQQAVAGLQAPNQVVQSTPGWSDMLAKAGVDLTAR